MASPRRNSAALLLFVSTVIYSHHVAHAGTVSPPATRRQIKFMTAKGPSEDYNYDYDDNRSSAPKVIPSTMKTPFLHTARKLCQYNPCLENQEPCEQLAAEAGCLCPGKSGGDQPPHAPRIQTLLPVPEGENAGKVEVRWCAPSSVVSSYRVTVEGRDGDALEFRDASRRGLVGALEVGMKVCVQAVNNAGHSSPSDFSCKRYDHTGSSDHELLAWVVGGGVAFILLLLLAAVILCRCQKRNSGNGLGNPSYSKEGAS